MEFLIQNGLLVLLALTSGGLLIWSSLGKGGGSSGISPNEAVNLINRHKAVLVDVCEPAEYAAAHVAGARNVPLGQLQDKLPGVAKNKALPLVLVCASGMRSQRAVAVARQLGYENVSSLTGGLSAWRAANLPVHKA